MRGRKKRISPQQRAVEAVRRNKEVYPGLVVQKINDFKGNYKAQCKHEILIIRWWALLHSAVNLSYMYFSLCKEVLRVEKRHHPSRACHVSIYRYMFLSVTTSSKCFRVTKIVIIWRFYRCKNKFSLYPTVYCLMSGFYLWLKHGIQNQVFHQTYILLNYNGNEWMNLMNRADI